MIHLNSKIKISICILLIIIMAIPLFGRRRHKKGPSSLVRKSDIMIWDEDHMRGRDGGKRSKGWLAPTDFWSFRGDIERNVFNGKYGVTSGKVVYTTYRPVTPLTDDEYSEGKKSSLDNHMSNMHTGFFELKKDYITFLISGGNSPNTACINLLVDGKIVRTATGRNNDYLEWAAFDVKEFKGKKVRIQILDKSTAPSDYINIDCICQSPDTKGAVRVIKKAPLILKESSFIETVDSKIAGTASIKDSSFLVNGKSIQLKNVLKITGNGDTGNPLAKRVELINGDSILADIKSLENKTLKISHPLFGEKSLGLDLICQVKFTPGPSNKTKPGTLVHANGNKIPGELTWIRKDNISIKCALGQLALPISRVNGFVFNEKKPANNQDHINLKDGSSLSGKISIKNNSFYLEHKELGSLKLKLNDVSQIRFHKTGLTPLSTLKFKVTEQSGPILPPKPEFITSTTQNKFRIYPGTSVNFTLPDSQSSKKFKAILKPVKNCTGEQTITLISGRQTKTFSIPAKSKGIAVDFDLRNGKNLEIKVSNKTVSYPSGVEWHGAIIIEDKQ